MSSSFVLINGFDRSGTTAITRLLAMHQDVELIMHPFNSGFIRKKMYQILNEKDANSPEHIFFTDLVNNELNNDLINSHWHDKYSSTKKFQKGKLHLVKTTINHFAQKWMNEHYSEIDVWGIWRNPEGIVDSILRNNLYGKWYDDAIEKIISTVNQTDILAQHYSSFTEFLDSIVKKTAFLVAVRNYFFFKHLKPRNVLSYESFKHDPKYLNIFLATYNLSLRDFSSNASKDLNIVGKYQQQKEFIDYTEDELSFMNSIFTPLKVLMKERHNIS